MRNPDTLRGADEIADFLGVDVSVIYRLAQKMGGLPFYRVGRCILSRKSTLNAWVENQMSRNAGLTDSLNKRPSEKNSAGSKPPVPRSSVE